MAVTEPINLREWKTPAGSSWPGRLLTCGRPGRATHGRAKVTVAEEVIDLWERGLPQSAVLHVVSLLGQKTSGLSEFNYYPFRSATQDDAKPVFECWLNERYKRQFVVHEFPTVDRRGIPPSVLVAASRQVAECLEGGHTTVVIDSCAPQIFDLGRTDAVAGPSASCGMIEA